MPIEILPADILKQERDPLAFWPTKPDDQTKRLNPMCLPAIRPSFNINKEDLIFTIGSCFARNIEKQLIVEDFNVAARQFAGFCAEEECDVRDDVLNKFVAGSILAEMRWALDPNAAYDERSIVQFGRDRYLDMQLAPGMMPASLDKVRAVRRAVSRYMSLLRVAKVVIITLGLAEGWFDKEVGVYINRAPQKSAAELYPGRFEVHLLSYEDIVQSLEEIIALLKAYGHPEFRIVLTVSPVALGMTWTDDDALVANCYSKSVQRAAASYIYKKHDCVDYLPSYESVTLSDRRIAWREDAAHVTDEAVRMNVLRMLYAYTGLKGSLEDDQKRAVALQLVRDAEAAAKAGRPADAMRAIHLAREIAPQEVAVAHRYGALLIDAGRYEEAASELETAYRGGGARYGSAELLGVALLQLGRAEEAINYLEEAFALNLKVSKAPRHLAEAYWRAGRHEEALRFIRERGLPSATKKASLALVGARILQELGRYSEGLEMIEIAVAEQPDSPKIQNLRDKLAAAATGELVHRT